jgi:hypothetical protein
MNTTCTEPTRTVPQQPTADELLRDVAFALRLGRQAAQAIRDEAARVNPRTLRREADVRPVIAV